jgi:type II secretory pathway component PulK
MDHCHPRRWRKGAILIVILLCLAVAAAVSIAVVRQAALQRQAAQLNRRSLQACWLAEAGLERAAARLATDGKYAGETWTVAPAELAADERAVVKIRVETPAGRPERRSLRVEADYADGSGNHARQEKQITVDREAIGSSQPAQKPAPK